MEAPPEAQACLWLSLELAQGTSPVPLVRHEGLMKHPTPYLRGEFGALAPASRQYKIRQQFRDFHFNTGT
jgi:hypothetical protein